MDDLGFGKDFLGTVPKTGSMKEIINDLDLVKSRSCALQKTLGTTGEDKPQAGGSLQKTWWTTVVQNPQKALTTQQRENTGN